METKVKQSDRICCINKETISIQKIVLVSLTCIMMVACNKDNEKFIPMDGMDDIFKSYLLENFDRDVDGVISEEEASLVKEMDCSSKGINSLDGIQYFSNLEILICRYNALHAIDISNNSALKYFDCGNNPNNKKIDVSKNQMLETLITCYNPLEELIINDGLKKLDIEGHKLSSLDFSGNKSLKELYCFGESIINLDVSHSILDSIECGGSNFRLLNLDGCSSLKKLICGTNIDFSSILKNCPNLEHLNVLSSSIDVSHCQLLKILRFSGYVTDLDLTNNPALEELSCNWETVVTNGIDMSNNLKLVKLDINVNVIKGNNVDLSNRKFLKSVSIKPYAPRKEIETVNLSGCASLNDLTVSGLQLKSLNINGCTALSAIDCSYNQLTELKIEDSKALKELLVSGNKLSTLKINSEQLSVINCGSNPLTNMDFIKNSQLKELYCFDMSLHSLDLSGCPSLEILNCSINSLEKLDVSKCPNLSSINCKENRLKPSFDVSKCRLLTEINCMDNSELTELILYKNHIIKNIDTDSQTKIVLSD